MAEGITLIVGLGNPGTEHTDTRHNAGFRFLDSLLERTGGRLRDERKLKGRLGRVKVGNKYVWLFAPMTYMNNSGEAVVKCAHYYRIAPQQILVAHDELDLPLGTVKLKQGGGYAGHNGVRDIATRLGSADFVRLRIGIGRPGSCDETVSHVLRKAPPAEQELIDAAMDRALSHIDDIINGRYQRVMTALHTQDVDHPDVAS
ncbi:MAG: aminoacyl-tRNA hydrolase [Gammaproteobacteria bacterium]|jgi:PTH1 family peptidyl-tRNA hydrolase|nr:aminoacyl-tRNA hydrolase [Gammaproteobacteria bacterium]